MDTVSVTEVKSIMLYSMYIVCNCREEGFCDSESLGLFHRLV